MNQMFKSGSQQVTVVTSTQVQLFDSELELMHHYARLSPTDALLMVLAERAHSIAMIPSHVKALQNLAESIVAATVAHRLTEKPLTVGIDPGFKDVAMVMHNAGTIGATAFVPSATVKVYGGAKP